MHLCCSSSSEEQWAEKVAGMGELLSHMVYYTSSPAFSLPESEVLGHSSLPERSNSSSAALFKSSLVISEDRDQALIYEAHVIAP